MKWGMRWNVDMQMLSGHVDIVTCAITNPSGQVSDGENENENENGDETSGV